MTDALLGVDLGGSGYRVRAVRVLERRPLLLEVDERFPVVEELWEDGFEPVDLDRQLAERERPQPTHAEEVAAAARSTALLDAIRRVAAGRACGVALAAPGLKTADRRGIVAARFGPRSPLFLDRLREEAGPDVVPAARLVGDGLAGARGEQVAAGGLLRDVSCGLYLGGGSGVAEAFVARGRATELDALEPPVPRAFELALPGQGAGRESYQDTLAPRRLLEGADGLGCPAERERFAQALSDLVRLRMQDVRRAELGDRLERVVLAQAFAFLPATFVAACEPAAALVELRISTLRAAPSLGAVALALDHEHEVGDRAWSRR